LRGVHNRILCTIPLSLPPHGAVRLILLASLALFMVGCGRKNLPPGPPSGAVCVQNLNGAWLTCDCWALKGWLASSYEWRACPTSSTGPTSCPPGYKRIELGRFEREQLKRDFYCQPPPSPSPDPRSDPLLAVLTRCPPCERDEACRERDGLFQCVPYR